jgi:transposase
LDGPRAARTRTSDLASLLAGPGSDRALVMAICPQLLDLPGVGALTAAQFIVSWSHAGPIRNEAAFAALAGVAPIPASSGQDRPPPTQPVRRPSLHPSHR